MIKNWSKEDRIRQIKIVLGIEPGFHGERYIKQRIFQENEKIKIFTNKDKLIKYLTLNL